MGFGLNLQPFGHKLYRGIAANHLKNTQGFLSKTVMVKNNDVNGAFRVLNKNLAQEGILFIIRNTKYFEKPFLRRQRLSYEASRAIYNEDMKRRIEFTMRKNRLDPLPGEF